MLKLYAIAFTLMFLVSVEHTEAQEMNVVPVEKATEDGKQPGLSIVIPDADRKTIRKAWKKHMKDYENEKVRSRRKSVSAKNLRVEDISQYPMDVMAKLKETQKGINLTVFWKIGGQYLNQDQDNYESAKAFVKAFATKQRKLILTEKLEEQQDVLEERTDRKEELNNEKEELNEQIEECKKLIKDSEKALKNNAQQLSEAESAIEEQNEKLEQLQEKLEKLD